MWERLTVASRAPRVLCVSRGEDAAVVQAVMTHVGSSALTWEVPMNRNCRWTRIAWM